MCWVHPLNVISVRAPLLPPALRDVSLASRGAAAASPPSPSDSASNGRSEPEAPRVMPFCKKGIQCMALWHTLSWTFLPLN